MQTHTMVRGERKPAKIAPSVAAMPQKRLKFRAILDLLFNLLINGFEMTPVNEATRYTSKQEAIEKLVKVLLRIIADIAE